MRRYVTQDTSTGELIIMAEKDIDGKNFVEVDLVSAFNYPPKDSGTPPIATGVSGQNYLVSPEQVCQKVVQ